LTKREGRELKEEEEEEEVKRGLVSALNLSSWAKMN
jgi:hypothetical protein